MINCLINGQKQGKKYPEKVRQFCLRQYYYSPAAYQSLRTYFNKNLPSKRTIKMWYSSVDGSPGINVAALNIIREKAEAYEAENHHKLHLTLISDEMSIKKQISWNIETQTFTGFSSITNSSQHPDDEDTDQEIPKLKVAKDALVFLVVGPNFKIPVGYHLLNGLDSIDRAALTLEVVRTIEQTGAVLMSLTSDGLKANVTVAELLGARFNEKKPYFCSPTYPEKKIYFIFDPPHMIKLVRKHFSTGNLYHQNQLLDWDLLRTLVEKQSSENFNFCNKMTHRHINWSQRPMNVKLAVETISKSVADCLEQLRSDGYEEFKDCEKTVEFLRFFNNAFDILNFAKKIWSNNDNNYKQPICEATAEKNFSFLRNFNEFVGDLNFHVTMKNGKICSKPILKSRAYMGFFGFSVDAISLEGIYEDFVKNGPLEEFYTMQFSQDHIETFFSLVRNSQGRNDNPNTIEFRSAFRKLLVCHPLTTSADHNVISNATEILTVSSTAKKRPTPADSVESLELELEVDYEEIILNEIESMDPYNQHVCAYVALKIEERITKTMNRPNKNNCSECASVFAQNDKINDDLLAMKNNGFVQAQQPCESTLKIVIFSNALMKIMSSNDQGKRFDTVWKTIHGNLDIDDLYNGSNFEHNNVEQQVGCTSNHKEKFVIEVLKTLLTLKSEKIGQRITDEECGVFIRNRMKTKIHASGQ